MTLATIDEVRAAAARVADGTVVLVISGGNTSAEALARLAHTP